MKVPFFLTYRGWDSNWMHVQIKEEIVIVFALDKVYDIKE